MKLFSIECAKCGTEITLDASRKAVAPEFCPSCKERFDSVSVQGPLDQYVTVYENIVKMKHKVRLKIKAVIAEGWK